MQSTAEAVAARDVLRHRKSIHKIVCPNHDEIGYKLLSKC
jgi:hypothetical protein